MVLGHKWSSQLDKHSDAWKWRGAEGSDYSHAAIVQTCPSVLLSLVVGYVSKDSCYYMGHCLGNHIVEICSWF